jgi:spermidine synthase
MTSEPAKALAGRCTTAPADHSAPSLDAGGPIELRSMPRMKPWVVLASTDVPGGGHLVLSERDGTFVIRLDGQELMSNRARASEEAMAQAVLPAAKTGGALLIGGLGMGFTLRAALDVVGKTTEVVQCEIAAAVVDWNRTFLRELNANAIADPRVQVEVADVLEVLERPSSEGRFIGVLLDIDNGPDAMTTPTNARLYGDRGIDTCKRALMPGGRLVVWSATPAPRYPARLRRAGFDVTELRVDASPSTNKKHILYVAATRAR